jgi:DNA-binding beta-propeller fold protein YncE
VWVGDANRPRVFRVDPAVPDRVETITVPSPVTGLAVIGDRVWVTGGDEDRVTVVDAATGAVLTSLEVGSEGCDQPEAITAGAGAIWVGCRVSGTVIRIEPTAGSVTGSLATGGAPAALVADDHERVWIAVGPA